MKYWFEDVLPIRVFHLVIMATAISSGIVILQLSIHVASLGLDNSLLGHFIHALADTALLLPLALFVIVIGLVISARTGMDIGNWQGIIGSASVISVLFFFGAIPGVSIHGFSHNSADRIVEGFSNSQSVNLDDRAKVEMRSLSETGFHGFHDAAVSQIVVLPMTILALLLVSKSGNLANGASRQEPRN